MKKKLAKSGTCVLWADLSPPPGSRGHASLPLPYSHDAATIYSRLTTVMILQTSKLPTPYNHVLDHLQLRLRLRDFQREGQLPYRHLHQWTILRRLQRHYYRVSILGPMELHGFTHPQPPRSVVNPCEFARRQEIADKVLTSPFSDWKSYRLYC